MDITKGDKECGINIKQIEDVVVEQHSSAIFTQY
jgi:hypothetical protein